MELIRRLASRVGLAVADGAFPLVLAGNCNSSPGTTAGIPVVRDTLGERPSRHPTPAKLAA
jgi:hypothetical protein